MTIAFVFEIFLPIVNGVITTTFDLAKNLQNQGNKVIFIAPAWDAYQNKEVEGIPVHYISSKKTYFYPGVRLVSPWNTEVGKILKDEACDIVHITGPWLLSWSVMKAAHRQGLPVVHTFHTLLYQDKYLYYIVRTKLLLPLMRVIAWKYISLYVNRSDIMTAPTQHACRTLVEHYPKKRIEHIRDGIDLGQFAPFPDFAEFVKTYPQFTRKTYLFIGRLGEEKSVSILLEAFRKAYDENTELRLFIVGDGPGRSEYENTVKKSRLENAVVFLGRLPYNELLHSGLYQHARAMVTASTTETQCMTVSEAIACRTPIIIPDVEGINELLFDNGLSFPANNADAFAECMVRLAEDDALYESCRGNSKAILDTINGEKVAKQFEQLYREALQNFGGKAERKRGKKKKLK